MILLILIIFLVLLTLWTIVTYNRFITLQERVENGKAQIAAQIESRWDAVGNLISATKEYAQYESEALEKITYKRTSLGKNSSIKEIENNDTEFNNVIGRLIAISENYPDLKASEVYQTTMDSVNKFEDYVRGARMIYNDIVTRFNRQLKIFPSNIVAKLFNFTEKEYFESSESKAEMPTWN